MPGYRHEITVEIVAEVQTSRPDHQRSLKWPAYAAATRVRHDCDTYLLVFATSRRAAIGSAKTIRIGHPGWNLTPLVTGIGRTPGLPGPGGAYASELTLLRVVTGDLSLDTHDARMFAVAALRLAPPERLDRYTRYLKRLAPVSARGPLEDLMKTVWKDDFVDGWLDKGRAQGRLAEAREMLLRILERRLAAPAAIRERVEGCADLSTLNTWFDRAITADSLADVFG
jgi:hypothetical protein